MPATKPKKPTAGKDLGKRIKATSGGTPSATAKASAAPSPAAPKPQPAKPAPVSTGRPAAVWFSDEDRATLRELSMVLLGQGIDPTHSLIVRALLRIAPRDERLIESVRELLEQDGRKLRHRKPAEQEAVA